MKSLLLCTILFLLTACGQKQTPVSNVPMLTGVAGGPWPVQIYNGDQVKWEVMVRGQDGAFITEAKSVYVSEKSQFVLRDVTPIKTFDDQPLYWNADGFIITPKLVKIPEGTIFTVGGKPMKSGTAMRVMLPSTKNK